MKSTEQNKRIASLMYVLIQCIITDDFNLGYSVLYVIDLLFFKSAEHLYIVLMKIIILFNIKCS